MRKKLVSAIDGIRNNLHNIKNESGLTDELELEIHVEEKITPQNCVLSKIVRHGFPNNPRCIAFDCVQRLLAIGSANGAIRLFGQSGVDFYLEHNFNEAVLFVQFLVNEGGLITVLQNDTIHLWNYRQNTPKIVHSLKMAKERVSCVYLPFQSKWLYIGTDKGNTYFLSLASFELSAYVINWNKAIDVSSRTHPGSVRQFSLCPNDQSRLLIVFENGCVVLWNIQTRESERFATDQAPTKCVSWNFDGRQFICGHFDGSITTWNSKKPKEVVNKIYPHSTSKQNSCKFRPITNLYWISNLDNEQLIVFTGGMPKDEGVLPALTILRAKGSITVFEMDYPIINFCILNASPYTNTLQYPYGIAVLSKADLLIIDLLAQGYPCFECPYSIDIHESPVTFISYYSDCPVDLIAALTLVGRNQRKQGARLSDKPWPITGGIGRECATGHQEMLLTGHEDGSIKFWQASSENLLLMYKLKTGRHFERILAPTSATTNLNQNTIQPSDLNTTTPAATTTETNVYAITVPSLSEGDTTINASSAPSTEKSANASLATTLAQVSYAVINLELCVDLRLLLVAGACGQVTLFRFVKTESSQDIAVIMLPQLCSSLSIPLTPTFGNMSVNLDDDKTKSTQNLSLSATCELRRQRDNASSISALSSQDSHSTNTSTGSQIGDLPIKVRGGAVRRSAGFQPELVCQIPWVSGQVPERITAIALNSAFGVLAIGTAAGIALVDIVTSMPIYTWNNLELLGRNVQTPNLSPATAPSDIEHMHCRNQSMNVNLNSSVYDSNSASSCNNSSNSLTGNLAKSFVRFNTDVKQRTVERQKAVLSKAQSMAVPSCTLNVPIISNIETSNFNDNENGLNEEEKNTGSRSSSINSIEQNNLIYSVTSNLIPFVESGEFVTSFMFINSFPKKGSKKIEPTFWVSTTNGTTIAFSLIMSTDRFISNVVVVPTGNTMHFKGKMLYITFLDKDFCLLAEPSDTFKDPSKDSAPSSANNEKNLNNKVLTKKSFSPSLCNLQDASANSYCSSDDFQQLGVFVSEDEIKVISLPGYMQCFLFQPEISLVKAKSSHINGYPVLLCLNAASNLIVLSLPSLKLLMQAPLFKGSINVDDDICKKTDFSEHGLGMYCASPSEIQKFTVSADLATQVLEYSGELFIPCDTPEPPKTSFLKGVSTLFGSHSQRENVDLDTIFSEKPIKSTTSVKSVAQQIINNNYSTNNLAKLRDLKGTNTRSITAAQAANMAIQNLNERGDRLHAVVDATERLQSNAQNFQSRSSKLVEKYEKKKWYQL